MTRETICGAAEALFMEQGIQATSLADIAEKANISKGTLFYHFHSKEDLILEIASQHIEKVNAEVLALGKRSEESASPRFLYERFLTTVLGAVLRNKLHLYLIDEAISQSARLRAALKEKYGEWTRTMMENLEPAIGDKARALAPALVALADGLIIQAMLGVDIPPLDPLVSAILPA